MEKEIDQLKTENKEKDEALIELSQFYYVSIIIILSFIFIYSILKTNVKIKVKVKAIL